jgi:hypothetical protein
MVEWFYQSRLGRSQKFGVKRALTNFNLGGSYLIFELIIHALVVLPSYLWLYRYRLFLVTLLHRHPIFVAVEFGYYWFHPQLAPHPFGSGRLVSSSF